MFFNYTDFGYYGSPEAKEKQENRARILNALTPEQIEAVKAYGFCRYSEGEQDGENAARE